MSFITNMVVNNGNYSNKDLSQIFPCYEIFTAVVNNSTGNITLNFTLTNNKTNTINYYVFPSYYYIGTSSGSTYGPHDASIAANSIMVYQQTTTGFQILFNKNVDKIWNGGINCFVIYPN